MKKKKNLLVRKENLLARLNFWWPRASGRRLMWRLWQMHLNMNLCSLQCLPFFTVTSPGPLILGNQLTWGCACRCHPVLAGHTTPLRKWSSSCSDLWLPRKDDSRPRESNAGASVILLPTRVTACHWSVVDSPKTWEFRPSWCDVSDQTTLTQFWHYYSNATGNNIIPNSLEVNFVNAADEQTYLTLNVTKHTIYIKLKCKYIDKGKDFKQCPMRK